MNKTLITVTAALGCLFVAGCRQETASEDRSNAEEMYRRICELTKEYTVRLEYAPDSADWAQLCSEFEEKLDKVSFSYPPDTDLLLTEGQNDTIHALMQEFVKARGERIHGILHPIVETDTVPDSESLSVVVSEATSTSGSADASRSRDN